jgi:hypothetical protein
MAEKTEPLQVELLRLLKLAAETRETGDLALAERLTKQAAKCLVNLANAQAGRAPRLAETRPDVQQQQQIQSDKDEGDNNHNGKD